MMIGAAYAIAADSPNFIRAARRVSLAGLCPCDPFESVDMISTTH